MISLVGTAAASRDSLDEKPRSTKQGRPAPAGIESTQIYLHADLALKEKALALTAPVGAPPGRYRPPDALLAFVDSL
ncbi:MAG: hypothetical protein H0X42_09640 [Solirubrobacterales bacterium]|nr:hypothetical protein [Solirubrobacterales bacterium]